MDRLQAALSDVGLREFRALQREAVGAVLDKQDTVVIVATGGGKSLCYQLPAIITEGISLVISPLISLAKDQVDNWNARGSSIDAQAYNCTVPSYVKEKICKDVACGEPMLLYLTPEACSRDQVLRDALKEACDMGNICCLAIDEVCCSICKRDMQVILPRMHFPGDHGHIITVDLRHICAPHMLHDDHRRFTTCFKRMATPFITMVNMCHWRESAMNSVHMCMQAHCVSQWGHDFRNSYLELVNLRATAGPLAGGADGPPPMICLTATCTDVVLNDVISCLGLKKPLTLKHSFNRPNLQYSVRFKDALATCPQDLKTDSISAGVVQDICNFIEETEGQSGIIYCRTRDQCEGVAKAIGCYFCNKDSDYEVAYYHAGLGQSDRNRIQQQWSDGSIVAVVATIAFGMGIDKADIRWVIHWSLSGSLEAFSQESGRAGRDGDPSRSIVYVSPADVEWCTKICKAHEKPKVGAMVEYAQEISCRRSAVLSYFNEKNGRCKPGQDLLCDVCACPAAVRSAQNAAEKRREALEVGMAAKAAKENEVDACNAQDGQKKASWHRATGSVARPQPPKNTLPDEPPAPDAASHGLESGAHNQNKRANQPQLMLRTPALRARVIPAEAAKETPKGDSQGCLSQEPPSSEAPSVVAFGRKPLSFKRKFVPPRTTS